LDSSYLHLKDTVGLLDRRHQVESVARVNPGSLRRFLQFGAILVGQVIREVARAASKDVGVKLIHITYWNDQGDVAVGEEGKPSCARGGFHGVF
jgi:hypothetical protein